MQLGKSKAQIQDLLWYKLSLHEWSWMSSILIHGFMEPAQVCLKLGYPQILQFRSFSPIKLLCLEVFTHMLATSPNAPSPATLTALGQCRKPVEHGSQRWSAHPRPGTSNPTGLDFHDGAHLLHHFRIYPKKKYASNSHGLSAHNIS